VRVKEVVDIMYSPDNFSPPPMEDMSPTSGFPPPLDFPPDCSSPESGAADEEELEEDGDYDLTGLSDKLHTLELRKISNLPPREILELQKASEEMNSRFANSLQGMRIPGGEGMGDQEEEDSVTPPVQQFVLEKESDPAPLEDLPAVDLNQNIPESISDVVEDHEQAFTLHKAEDVIQEDIPCNSCDQDMPQCDELETIYNDLNGDCDDLEENPSTQGESLKVETEAVIENVLGEELVSGSCGQTEGTGVVEGGWNAFPPNEDEDWGEPVKGGDWGDFSDLNRTVEAEGFKGEEEDDDEFGDFGEAEEAVPMASRDVTGLLERLEELRDWSDLGEILGEEGRQGETDCEKRLGQELGSQVEEDEVVWRLLEDPASSPGLDYVWRDSGTYNIILSTLGIDSRVVLDGPGWLGQVRQAATLLTPGLLTPVPAAARQEKEGGQLETQDPLAPSGEAAGRRKAEVEEARREKIVRTNSNPGKEAAEILRAFPLLDFMASSLLVRNKK